MKANELTIGDWVRSPKNADGDFYAAQVGEIMQGGEHYYCNIPGPDGNDSIRCDDLSPVPLTEEMLLKNGFRRISVDAFKLSFFESDCNEWAVVVDLLQPRCSYIRHCYARNNGRLIRKSYDGFIESVHELQHKMQECDIEIEFKL